LRTFLLTTLLAFVCATQIRATCLGCYYTPPSINPPSVGSGADVSGGIPLPPDPSRPLYTGTYYSGFVVTGPMDVKAAGGDLTLQFTVTAAFTPNTTTNYWIHSSLYDLLWSNLPGTGATVESLTSDAYIGTGTCPGECTILAEASTVAGGTPAAIPYDPASDIATASDFLALWDSWSTSVPVGLAANQDYTLVHVTTFQLSHLALDEVIRIDLPETSRITNTPETNTPEPATCGLVAAVMVLAGWARWRIR
jgi:hypothetical protein